MSIKEILFISTWFGIGFITMIIVWISDMRGEEFDKDYFDIECIFMSLLTFVLGYVSLIASIGLYCYKQKPFTRFIYKIANIGIKNSNKDTN